MADLLVVYGIEMSLNTGTDEAPVWAVVGEGFNNLAESLNEVIQQYFFLNGGGFADNFVTGMAPAYTLSGVRVLGDAAQEYIFGTQRKFGIMDKRRTSLKITRQGASGQTETITCPCTLCNVTDTGGGTTDGSAVSVEIRLNGKPTIE